MKIKDIITESNIEEQRLDEFLPLALAALGGTAAGATLGDYILQKRKGAKDWNFGQSVGRNLERGERLITQKAAPAAEKLAKDIYKGYTGKDAPETLDQWLDLGDVPDLSSPDKVDQDRVRRRQDFETPWPDAKNEDRDLKKKHKVVDEETKTSLWDYLRGNKPAPAASKSADKTANAANKKKSDTAPQTSTASNKNNPKEKSSFELEIEKNFSDPYTRKAIMAKARQESGGRNIGEMDWTRTSNDKLKAAFPQLKHLDDTQLNNLKAQGNTVFLDYAYKGIGGYKYRGRGPIQITGKRNYEVLDKQLGLNGALVKDPDMLLRDPALANAASVQYLKNAGIHKKTFDNQRQAHQEVIYAIGGPSYAPGSKRGNRVLASIENEVPVKVSPPTTTAASTNAGTKEKSVGTATTAATTAASTNAGTKEKPDADTTASASTKEKSATANKKGSIFDLMGTPVDTGKSGDIIAQASQELAAKRAAIQRPSIGATKFSQPVVEPSKLEPKVQKIDQEPQSLPMASAADYEKSGKLLKPTVDTPYDEFMNKLTKSQYGHRIPESVNTEIELTEILKLAGFKK